MTDFTNPRVTVMMPVYNGERLIRQAIESVLNQTFTDFELLIVDDGSTDGTQEIIHTYHDSRIRVIRNAINQGVFVAREQVLHAALGDYVAVLDADDIAYPDRLRLQVAYLDTHPDVGLVGSAYESIDVEGRTLSITCPPCDPVAVRWTLLFRNCICNSTAVYRRSLALDVGGYSRCCDVGAEISEDFDLWTRLAAVAQVAQLNHVLVKWRDWESQRDLQTGYSRNVSTAELKQRDIRQCSIVARSIRQCTGQEVSPQVAACFAGMKTSDPFAAAVIDQACQAVGDCALSIAEMQARSRTERRRLFRLMLSELLRIIRSSRHRRRYLLRLGLCYGLRYVPADLLSPAFALFVLKVLTPSTVKRVLRPVLPGG